MCLKSIDLILKWNRWEKAYVGIGYKVYENDRVLDKKVWLEANGYWGHITLSDKGLPSKLIQSTKGDTYHPGFHIFLNKKDAEDYEKISGHQVYLVRFKDVLGYGMNITNRHKRSKDKRLGKCVISRYMKIVEKIK